MNQYSSCPKCGAPRLGVEKVDPLASCTECGLIFSRYKPRPARPGAPHKSGDKKPVSTFALVGGFVLFSWAVGTVMQKVRDPASPTVAPTLETIDARVAREAVTQFEIAKRSGTPMDACVQAGMVAAAYLQAMNEPAYAQWKATEQRECLSAGLSR